MKKSTFLFLKLFAVAGVMTGFITTLPYTHKVWLMVKDKVVQTIQPTGDLNQSGSGSTNASC